MAKKATRITRKTMASDLVDSLKGRGLTPGDPTLTNDGWHSQWCRLGDWNNGTRIYELFAYFGNYLSSKDWCWVGFGSQSIDIINDVRALFRDEQITSFSLSEWDEMSVAGSRLNASLSSPDNIAVEDYLETDHGYAYIGRYFPMAPDTLTQALQFTLDTLKEMDPVVFANDEVDIDNGPTERDAITPVRVTQNAFRKNLEARWSERCAVTGSSLKAALRASHIVPWAESDDKEKNSADNGLLLTASLDAFFDRGYISFEDDGKIILSSAISEVERIIHGLSPSMSLRTPPGLKQKTFLARHRAKHSKRLG